jgi:hypothetical protein
MITGEEKELIKKRMLDMPVDVYIYAHRPRGLKEDGTEWDFQFGNPVWEDFKRFKIINRMANNDYEFVEYKFQVLKKHLPHLKK